MFVKCIPYFPKKCRGKEREKGGGRGQCTIIPACVRGMPISMMFGLCPRFVLVDDVRVSVGDIFGLSHGFNEVRGIAGVNQAMLKNQKAP